MRNALLRAMHREEGYSLVISMLLMAIMMVLLAVSLDAGLVVAASVELVARVEQGADGGGGRAQTQP